MKKILTTLAAALAMLMILSGCITINIPESPKTSESSDVQTEIKEKVKDTKETVKVAVNEVKDEIKPAKNESKPTQTESNIGRDRAKEIALAAAGVSADDIYDYDCELDDGKYEVDFESNGIEYEYDIHPTTGEILKEKIERD